MGFSDQLAKQYLDEGFLVARDLVDPASLSGLIHDLDERVTVTARQLYEQGKLPSLFTGEPFDLRLVKLYDAVSDTQAKRKIWQSVEVKYFDMESEGLFNVMTHPAVLDVVEQLIGPEILFHPQSNLRAKLPSNEEGAVPWHQDSLGLSPDSERTLMINFWIPLVNVTMDMGGMQVMRGKHHTRPCLNTEAEGFAIRDEKLPKDEVVDCPLSVGSVLMIQKRTIHRSVSNTSNKVRWSLDFRYCNADQPAGRPGGFIARSKSNPSRAITNFEQYRKLIPQLRSIWPV